MSDPRDCSASPPEAFGPGEWAFLLAWPWVLAAAVALAVRGEPAAREGGSAAAVTGAAVAFLGLVGALLVRNAVCGLSPARRAQRAGVIAALAAALAAPAYVACAVGSPATPGTILAGPLLCGCACYAFVQAAAVAGGWYPVVAALWLGVPPFVYYLLVDFMRIDFRAHSITWILSLGPASGAVWAVVGPASAWARMWGPLMVLALVGAGWSLLPAEGQKES